jgi:hypothetical protein
VRLVVDDNDSDGLDCEFSGVVKRCEDKLGLLDGTTGYRMSDELEGANKLGIDACSTDE